MDINGQGDFNVIDEGAIRGVHRNKHFYEHRLTKNNQSKNDDDTPTYYIVKLPFVPKWLEDIDIRTSMGLCCDPARPRGFVQVVGGLMYNTWGGFYAERINQVSLSKENEAMTCFEDFTLTVVGDKPFVMYMMDYFANIIQHPESKTQVGILLQGEHGCGKSTIFNVWRAIVGKDSSTQTAKPVEDYFSRFSVGLKSKVLAQVCPPSSPILCPLLCQ